MKRLALILFLLPLFAAAQNYGDNAATITPVLGLQLNGGATNWDDSSVPPLTIGTGVTQPAITTGFAGYAALRLPYFQGGGATNDECWFTVQFPHGIQPNDTLYAHVHWSPTTNVASGQDTVVWELLYVYADLMTDFTTYDSVTMKAAGGANNQWMHRLNGWPKITGKSISSIFVGRLRRLDSDASDTYPGSAAFLGFDIHYKVNTLGSSEPTTK